jgi:hypothetical protein
MTMVKGVYQIDENWQIATRFDIEQNWEYIYQGLYEDSHIAFYGGRIMGY